MRKLLAGFLLTLRWLLVLLLPVLGLVGGLLLIPEVKPNWKRNLDDGKCAGITIMDDQPRVIIMDGGSTFYMGVPALDIITLDLATSEKVFTWKIDGGELSDIRLLPGTTLAVYVDGFSNHTITVTEWKNRYDLDRGAFSDYTMSLNSARYSNHVMIAELYRIEKSSEKCAIGIWRFEENQRVEPKIITVQDMDFFRVQLSSTGDWAVICRSSLLGLSANVARNELIDTMQGKVIQRLPDDIETIRWLPNGNSFLALHHDQKQQVAYWQKYDCVDGVFAPAGPTQKARWHGNVCSPDTNAYVILASSSSGHPWRIKLIEWLGESVLNRCWPRTTTIDLVSTSSGKLLQSMTIPDLGSSRTTIHPDPNGQGFLVQGWNHISYWEFPTNMHWQPYLGLAIGIILASLLAWRNLCRPSKRAAIAHSAP